MRSTRLTRILDCRRYGTYHWNNVPFVPPTMRPSYRLRNTISTTLQPDSLATGFLYNYVASKRKFCTEKGETKSHML